MAIASIVIAGFAASGSVGTAESDIHSGATRGAASSVLAPGLYRAPNGVAHRSGQAHLSLRTASPDRSDIRQAYPLRYASALGSSDVERRGNCASAKRAVRFYAGRVRYWLDRLGAPKREAAPSARGKCPEYLAHVLQRKAAGLHRRWKFLFDYRAWMPAFWRAIAVCESGSNPPNWQHDSGPYVSAFGITVAEYDRDAAVFGAPPWHVRHTPRDQYRAALGHQARFGLSGWGCYTHGGYLVHLGRV